MHYQPIDLASTFPDSALRGGVRLSEDGCVTLFDVRPSEGRVFGIVRESRGRSIRVSARMSRDGAGEPSLTGICACSTQRDCVHMAALLWQAMDPEVRVRGKSVLDGKAALLRRPAPPQPDPAPDHARAISRSKGSPFRSEVASPASFSDSARQRSAPGESEWLIRQWSEAMSRELGPPGPPPAPRGQQFQLFYIAAPASPTPGQAPSSVAIRPLLLALLKRGGYGRERRFDWYCLEREPRPSFLTEADEALLMMIEAARRARSSEPSAHASVQLHPDRAAPVLERAVQTGRCHWRNREGPLLRPGEPRSGALSWEVDAQGRQRATVAIEREGVEILPLAPPWYVDAAAGTCGPIETGLPARAAAAFLKAPALTPEAAVVARTHIEGWNKEAVIPAPVILRVLEETHSVAPVPRLFLHGVPVTFPFGIGIGVSADMAQARTPVVRLRFSYGEHTIEAHDRRPTIAVREGDVVRRVRRNAGAERTAARRLESLGLECYGDAPGLRGGALQPNDFEPVVDADPLDAMLDFVTRDVPQLEQEGWIVETAPSFPCRLARADADWYADIDQEPGREWFDLEMGVTVEGNKVNLLPLLVRLIHDEPRGLSDDPAGGGIGAEGVVIPLEDGRLLPVPAERVRRILAFLRELYDQDGLEPDGRLRLSVLQAPALAQVADEAAGAAIALSGGEQLRELGRRLRDFRGVEVAEPPRGLHGTLRHYQAEGLSWLQFLRTHGLGGLLADDMGLGKTIQGLAHLLVEKESARADRPSLVVAPTSLMVNWEREAAQFAPDLRILRLQGPDRRARLDSVEAADVVLTTYPLLWRDREALLAREYHVLILDEAQFLKNHKSKGGRVAREIRARHRLGFTGTPFENRLMELWSLFDILMPGVLGDEKRFKKAFVGPIEKHGDAEQRRRLSARVHPFLLRRTKDKVATELPPKTEIVQAVELGGAQRDLYETIRLAMHARVQAEIARKGLDRSRIVILDALLKLRQVCCDPRLLKAERAREVRESAKLEALLGMLEEMTAEGRRVLLFSQFTSMLALIEPELGRRAISFVKLTGDTRDRATPVAAFQAGEVGVFLISLKAGGTGLNLTAADSVILYDPWWNPAVEDQAMDRAHRIGQSKPVFVYRLIAAGSVEEKILAMQGRKRALVKSVLAPGEDAGVMLTEKDLESLFEPIG